MSRHPFFPLSRIVVTLVLIAGACPAAWASQLPFGDPVLLADVTPGPAGSTLSGVYPAGDVAVFLETRKGGSGTETKVLWRTDGTPAGTYDIHPAADLDFSFLTHASRFALFYARHRPSGEVTVWRTDGTRDGTMPLFSEPRLGSDMVHLQGKDLLLFSATESGSWEDLDPWVTDGTRKGTFRLADVFTGGPTFHLWMFELGGRGYFVAIDPETYRRVLWRTDGTPGGTRPVTDFAQTNVKQVRKSGGALWYFGQEPDGSSSLWRSDGTAEGTRRVRVFDGAADLGRSSVVGDFGDGRTLWLHEQEPASWSLWATDGTTAGTEKLMELATLYISGQPQEALGASATLFRGELYFQADDGTTGMEIWRTDGTAEGTEVAFETCPGLCSEVFQGPGVVGDRLIFKRQSPDTGTESWLSDGTAAGTSLLVDGCPGACSSGGAPDDSWEASGWYLFFVRPDEGAGELWASDLTPQGTSPFWSFAGHTTGFYRPFMRWTPDRSHFLFVADDGATGNELWAIPVDGSGEPVAPGGQWLTSSTVPGFEFKVRITGGAGAIAGVHEASCIPETVCVSGALPGRSEVFLRVVGPKPNGRMWPTLVKFSTSTVEVWVRQVGSGEIRYYRLDGASPGVDELPGLFDRTGFSPLATSAASVLSLPGLARSEPLVLAAGTGPTPPATVFTSEHFPGFRFRARISAGDQIQEVRKEAGCIEETLCLSGAIPGRSEVFLRIVGPKPNGRLWPTIVKFTTSTLEVWIEQVSTGEARYYRIEGAAPGQDDLTGLFDRDGF